MMQITLDPSSDRPIAHRFGRLWQPQRLHRMYTCVRERRERKQGFKLAFPLNILKKKKGINTMRKIRLISFICVLALALSMCSVFSSAAAPEVEKEVVERSSRANYIALGEVDSAKTYLYNSNSTSSGYVYNAPLGIGTYVYIRALAGSYYYVDVQINGTMYTGYVLKVNVTIA